MPVHFKLPPPRHHGLALRPRENSMASMDTADLTRQHDALEAAIQARLLQLQAAAHAHTLDSRETTQSKCHVLKRQREGRALAAAAEGVARCGCSRRSVWSTLLTSAPLLTGRPQRGCAWLMNGLPQHEGTWLPDGTAKGEQLAIGS